MRILHLSDLHLIGGQDSETESFIVKPLIEDLRSFTKERSIDLVLISGDLVYRGGDGFCSIESGFKYFEEKIINRISDVFEIPKSHFFFVPGNHDIIRSDDSKVIETGLYNTLKDVNSLNDYMEEDNLEGMRRIIPFKNFEKEYSEDNRKTGAITNFESFYSLEIDSKRVGVSCLNTSWRCYDSAMDKGRILIGEKQVTRISKQNADCDIKIALMHHDLQWLAEFDRKNVEPFLIKNHDLILCGHSHDTTAKLVHDIHGQYYLSVAPSNWVINSRNDTIEWANGYSILDLDEDKNLNVYFRRYSLKQQKYVSNSDCGDEQGVLKLSLSNNIELNRKQKIIKILDHIKSVYCEDLDQHLINYKDKSDTPKTIRELFVMPEINLYQRNNQSENFVKTDSIDLDYLCSQNNDMLLMGTKESGKTILLDRLLIEYVENYNKYARIPIYCNINEVNQTRIENFIKKFVGEKNIEDLLDNGDFILLLDNLILPNNKNKFLKKLDPFLKKYPKIKVIATCTTLDEEILPSNIIKEEYFKLFELYTIQQFRSKEMKELISKWFNDKNSAESTDKFNKIHQSFINLSIPRTPFNISMFLSILEKQENYKPINNATLLENYIEGLFEKQAEEEIYSEIFDYRNKERLLADIAYKMYITNDVNYFIEQDKLITHIKQYLKNRKFDFDEVEVLNIFIDKGILTISQINSISYVGFKFACFFKYFLMKTMEYNSEFKAEVLNQENYLHFIDEIDYYTGIKRDQVDILNICISTMYEAYSILNKEIIQVGGYDKFFETKSALSDKIDNQILENIQEDGKVSEEELNQFSDTQLQNADCKKGVDKKEGDLIIFDKLHRLWSLAAKVLKNTEEVTEPNLKTESFEKLLTCSMSFCCLYKVILNTYLSELKDKSDKEMKTLSMLLPLAHQMALSNDVATAKLSIVIKERFETIKDDSDISEFEKFILVFLYADVKGNGYIPLVEKFIKSINQNYIKDMTLYKLLKYYKFNKNTEKDDQAYLELMRILPSKSKQGRDLLIQRVKKDKLIHEVDKLIG